MKTWEEVEFEVQQEAIRKWAEKKLKKITTGYWFTRRLKRIQKLAGIISGNPNVVVTMSVRKNNYMS